MRHCCEFRADDTYYLNEDEFSDFRKLSYGFCPICGKPVAELLERKFSGEYTYQRLSGLAAHSLVMKLKGDILYSARECNYLRFKAKPYGWRFGVNREYKSGGKNFVKQYACDFYGNKEVIKIL